MVSGAAITVDVAKLRTVADQLAALGADDEALALVQTLDPAELAWLTAEFGRRAASMRRGAAWLEEVLHRAWPRAGGTS